MPLNQLSQLGYEEYAQGYSQKVSVENYSRVLYNNYRGRTNQSLPSWKEASQYVKKEFREQARAELGL